MTIRNVFLEEASAADIDAKVGRLLANLGPRPERISLEEVRDLLKLDLKYYSKSNPTTVDHLLHNLKVGAKQVLKDPLLLARAIAKFDLKALYVPERRQIYIDGDLHEIKKRWSEAHEVVHSLIPWHAGYALGDTKSTLSPACHEIIEAEANFGAGRLLFPRDMFRVACASSLPSMAGLKDIAKHFGNSITSTLWRYVEECPNPAFGLISQHPHSGGAPHDVVEYFIRSKFFCDRFPDIDEEHLLGHVRAHCSHRTRGPLGQGDVVISDAHGSRHRFLVDVFSNGHGVLTLGTYQNEVPFAMPVLSIE